ncbi:MAG: glutaredoxin family protein [Egibacteraceae bacterium]
MTFGGRYPDPVRISRRQRHRPVVTVYTRKRCGLCRTAEQVVARVSGRSADVELVDVDTDPALADRYTVRVPVIAIDGVEIAEYQVDPRVLRAQLRAARHRAYP